MTKVIVGHLWIAAALAVLLAQPTYAACANGTVGTCTLANGCKGLRECFGTNWGPCECAGTTSTGTCSVCGRSGTTQCNTSCVPVSNTCSAAESCNACDDNQNGQVDEGLYKCATGAFTQLTCSPSVATQITYSFGAPSVLPRSLSTSTYENNLNHSWRIYANPNVSTLALNFSSFVLGSGDYVSFSGQQFSGNLGSFNVEKPVGGVIASGIPMQFVSDTTGSGSGFHINRLDVKCGTSGASIAPTMTQSLRHDGLLLGTGDTLFFSIPGGPDTIFVWLDSFAPTGTVDFDLYVRSNSLPTKNAYTQRSASLSNQEALMIAGDTSGQTHFLAVTSFAGAGAFRLNFSRAKAAELKTQRVGIGWQATTVQVAAIKAVVQQNMLKFFGQTEGQIVVKSALFSVGGDGSGDCVCAGGACDVCYKSGNADIARCVQPRVNLYDADWDGFSAQDDGHVLAHEWGHCILNFLDEYERHYAIAGNPPPDTACHTDELCGHTVMANTTMRNNLCTALGHKKDTAIPGHVCSSCSGNGGSASCTTAATQTCAICPFIFGNNWDSLAGRATQVETLTPDNYNLMNHAGLAGLLTVN